MKAEYLVGEPSGEIVSGEPGGGDGTDMAEDEAVTEAADKEA